MSLVASPFPPYAEYHVCMAVLPNLTNNHLRAGAHIFLGWGVVEEDATSARHGEEQRWETEGDHERTPPSEPITGFSSSLTATRSPAKLPRI